MDYIIPLHHDINIHISMKVHKENWMDVSPYETDIESMEYKSPGWILYIIEIFGYCKKMPRWSLSFNYFIAE